MLSQKHGQVLRRGDRKGTKPRWEMPSVRSTSRDAADLELCSVESWTHEREGAKARQATFRGLAVGLGFGGALEGSSADSWQIMWMRDEAGCRWTGQWKGHFSFSGELGGEPIAPNWPHFNEILTCFPETTEQNRKLWSQNMHRGEDFDLKGHLESEFLHPRAKNWYLTRARPMKPLQKQGVCCPGRSGAEESWPHLTVKGQVPEPLHGNPSLPAFLSTNPPPPSPKNLIKPQIREVDFEIKPLRTKSSCWVYD